MGNVGLISDEVKIQFGAFCLMLTKLIFRAVLLCGLLSIVGSASATGYYYHSHYYQYYQGRGSIQGLAWYDANESGLRDRGESRLQGITVRLLDEDNNELMSTTTNRRGIYIFRRLKTDMTYFVKFDISSRSDVDFTTPDVSINRRSYRLDSDAVTIDGPMGTTKPVNLTRRYRRVRFLDVGLIHKASPPPAHDLQICGRAWVDSDGNGLQMGGGFGGDSNLGGAQVTLTGPDGSVSTTTNAANGNYFFEDLAPGAYQVSFAPVDGYEYTQSLGDTWVSGNRLSVINQQTGETIVFHLPEDGNSGVDNPCTLQNIDGGYEPVVVAPDPTTASDDEVMGEVGQELIVDVLANDAPAGGDVASVEIVSEDVPGDVVVNGDNAIVISDTTLAGVYDITYMLTSDNGTSDTAMVAVTLTDLPPPATEYNICGRTFVDANGDDMQNDPGSLLSGVSVTLLADDGSILQGPVLTAGGGRYEFTGVLEGNYFVQFDLLAPYTIYAAVNQGNSQFDSDADSDADGSGRTAMITLPIPVDGNFYSSREGVKPAAVCSVNWVDAGMR